MNVYDFDDTIYDGDTTLTFFTDFFKKDPTLVRYIPNLVKVMRDYRNLSFRFEDVVEKYGYIVTDYFLNSGLSLDDLAKEYWDKHEDRIKPFYKEIQKEDDLIISASPLFIIKEICERLGIKYYLGTDFDPVTGTFGKGCFRDNKIEFFREAFPDGVIDDFYTDSLHDEFLFPYAKRVFMVKGDKITQIK